MIEFVKGDLFESGCEALVNPVNCVGVMGKGLAKEFKQRYPYYFKEYQLICRKGFLNPGGSYLYKLGFANTTHFIISFATKNHWKQDSLYLWIEKGLPSLCSHLVIHNIKSVAVPALGAGLGGLDWAEVRPLMVAAFSKYPDILFKVYEPLEG